MRDARDVVHGVARPRAAATSGAGACRPPAETPGLAVFGRDIVRSRPATEHRLACPQPCPELGKSDPTQPHLDEQKHAQTNIKALPIEHFKTGRPWQPQGWKVRFLRRSALGTRSCSGFRPVRGPVGGLEGLGLGLTNSARRVSFPQRPPEALLVNYRVAPSHQREPRMRSSASSGW